jgi:FXSXX-COOH protein
MDNADGAAADQDPGLVDVSALPLSRLISSSDSVLAHSLSRILTELDERKDVLAAFGNFAPDPVDPDQPVDRSDRPGVDR